MPQTHSLFNSLQSFTFRDWKNGQFYSLPQLEKAGVGPISKLPVSLRIVLESVLRNYDNKRVREDDIRTLANWKPNAERTEEIPFVVARDRPARLHRRSAAGGPGRHALRGRSAWGAIPA